jgi:hypothetical protein
MNDTTEQNEELAEPAVPSPTDVVLTPDEMSDVTDHINRLAVAANDACPVCGSPHNLVAPNVYRMEVHREGPSAAIQYQPLYSTVCYNCGFVRFFNQNIVKLKISAHEAPEAGSSNGS